MSTQMSSKPALGCGILIGIAILAVSYTTSASFNPLAVYGSDSVFGKIAVATLAVLAGGMLLPVIFVYLMRKSVEMGARKPADDVVCGGCSLPLLPYVGSHGMPIACPKCRQWWHNGPMCYNKDMRRTKILLPTYPCPRCRAGALLDHGLYSDLDE